MSKYDPAIDKGIALLDERVPDWCKRMQLDHLDLNSSNSCVLGQCYGDFYVGLDALGMGAGLAVSHGFLLDHAIPHALWKDLTESWKQRIRQHCEAHDDAE